MQIFEANYRPGCAKPLTVFCKAFKKCWKMLALRPLRDQVYIIDLTKWTCSCGQQKYNAFLLCKHLVQAFLPPDQDFFREVVCRRVTPFYSHCLLRPKNGSELNVVYSGSVSDGDEDTAEGMEPTPSPASAPVRRTKHKRVQPAPMSPPATPGQTRGSVVAPIQFSFVLTRDRR
ncbi:hypothetical protein B0H14DRAFT_2352253 [Mycena olivaceomarginata]|nr:hypothetical protein B0H14DRAFT_2352253 [Mycena olivaceomarginata]